MFGSIEAVYSTDSIEGQNEKIAGILSELSDIFNGGDINPESQISGSSESDLNFIGGTFVSDSNVHAHLVGKLEAIAEKTVELEGSSEEISGAGYGAKSLESKLLKKAGRGLEKVNN